MSGDLNKLGLIRLEIDVTCGTVGRLGEGAEREGRAREVGYRAGTPGIGGIGREGQLLCSRCSLNSITRQVAFFKTYGTVLPRLNSPNRRL